MSCFGCKCRELRVLVMGTDRKVTESLVKEIQNDPDKTPQESCKRPPDCWVNICCPSKDGVSVTINGLNMVLFDIPTLSNRDDMSEMTERISKSAHHVFLLVMNQNPSEDKGKNEDVMNIEKEMVTEIKKTFGDDALKYTVVVFKNVTTDVETLKKDAPEICKLTDQCEKVTNQKPGSLPEEIQKGVNKIKSWFGGTCYTHKMLEAHSKKGGCKWENFSLPTKVCVLILCGVGIAVGYFLFCCGKELIETAASAATKGLMNVSE